MMATPVAPPSSTEGLAAIHSGDADRDSDGQRSATEAGGQRQAPASNACPAGL
ncbi:MAG TPA: hypothetical protein VG898_02595 [Solirubrobacterales bacterium]|nr:hypothetical protein [Solirubrobacterales bacterium]